MKFKIAVTCKRCDCCFELSPGDFKPRDSYECPNCGQSLPAEIYSNLKTGLLALGNVPRKYPKSDAFEDIFAKGGFEFGVKESISSNSFVDLED